MLAVLRRWWPLALIALAALWLRTHDLGRRPMHADEANQGVKTGELLESGRYAYDPRDHHGPTLYYAALPIAWLRGEKSLATLSETTLRLVPALAGTAAVVLLAFLAATLFPGQLNRPPWTALTAAALMAVTPPAVYYSRYFIQETLLVAFTLGSFLAFTQAWRTGRLAWAAAGGICIGLMQATKASAPLLLALGAVAAAPALRRTRTTATHGLTRQAALLAITAAVITAGVFFTSFGTNFSGLADALSAYGRAADRFSAGPTGHEKPWGYYLQLLTWTRSGGLVWHQLALLGLAAIGAGIGFRAALTGRGPGGNAAGWPALYTVSLLVALSAFAYKTPWHAVHFIPGLALLAAIALAAIASLRTGFWLALPLAVVTLASLYQQTARVAFQRPADARNPYAYVHSSPDVLKVTTLAAHARAAFPTEPIRVISDEYWPLPWYLRRETGVGFWTTPPEGCDGALIITAVDQAEAVRARLKFRYRETFLGLRPGVLCAVFIREP